MTKREYIEHCGTLPGAVIDSPFEMDFDTYVARHAHNKKWFALIMEHDNRTLINLKCEPLEAEFLRSVFSGVTAAYHMNKRHWNSVYLDSDVPDDMLKLMTKNSYELTIK